MSRLSHPDAQGAAHMVDVGSKAETTRIAIAEGQVVMAPGTIAIVRDGNAKKGDVLGTARLAGIMAAKRTHEPVSYTHLDVYKRQISKTSGQEARSTTSE